MKLLTKELRKQMPAIYSQEGKVDPWVVCKFFLPGTYWSWYVLEGEEREGEFEFFGLVRGHEIELGYFRLSDLEGIRGPWGLRVERDLYFKKTRLSQVRALLEKGA